MSNITIYNGQPADLVEVRLDEKKYPRIGATSEQDSIAYLREIVIGALMFRGLEQDEATVEFTATNLWQCMMFEGKDVGMQYLSWYEIAKVIRKASVDGTIIGVSVSSLYSALKTYCTGEGAQAQQKAMSIRSKQRTKELSAGQKAYLDAAAGAMVKAMKEKMR